jgi:copper resistance protein C
MKRRSMLCAIVVAILGGSWVGEAVAHARLVKSAPAADAVLSRSPTAISLWFNEKPELEFSTIRVLDSAGHVVAQGKLAITPEPNGLMLPVPALPAGNYRVRYRVLSVDGHILKAKFGFRVGAVIAR